MSCHLFCCISSLLVFCSQARFIAETFRPPPSRRRSEASELGPCASRFSVHCLSINSSGSGWEAAQRRLSQGSQESLVYRVHLKRMERGDGRERRSWKTDPGGGNLADLARSAIECTCAASLSLVALHGKLNTSKNTSQVVMKRSAWPYPPRMASSGVSRSLQLPNPLRYSDLSD